MNMFFANDNNFVLVNGEFVQVQDMRRRLLPSEPLLPPLARQEDEDDAMSTDDELDEKSLSETKTEDGRNALMDMIHLRKSSEYDGTLKMPTDEGGDPSTETQSKGKGKEREKTPTPEPQVQPDLGVNIFQLLKAQLEAMQRKSSSFPYAFEEPDARNSPSPVSEYEDFQEADFEPPLWGLPREGMFPSYFMVPESVRVRRPQPEFVTGPSRITLDDL